MIWTTRITRPIPLAGPPKCWASGRRSCGLDTAGAVTPQRTAGGRRRYTRRQLAFAARIRELFDQDHTLAAALRILALEDDLAAERALTARLRERLAGQDRQDEG
jgi:DNA-binding transcriptional MerR regulator